MSFKVRVISRTGYHVAGTDLSARAALRLAAEIARKGTSRTEVTRTQAPKGTAPAARCVRETRALKKNAAKNQHRAGCTLTPAFKALVKSNALAGLGQARRTPKKRSR